MWKSVESFEFWTNLNFLIFFIVTSILNNSIYPRSFLCEKAKIKQRTSSKKNTLWNRWGSNMGIPIHILFFYLWHFFLQCLITFRHYYYSKWMFLKPLIWPIFFLFLLYRKVLKFWFNQTFGWLWEYRCHTYILNLISASSKRKLEFQITRMHVFYLWGNPKFFSWI